MHLFNLDIHVSVIEDVVTNLQQLGHTVESHVMSAHYWALDKPRACRGTGDLAREGNVGFGSVNLATWEGMWWEQKPDDALSSAGKRWHAENPQLEDFDGYICCYPPAFALLYEKFSKHIIINMPVRYEFPFTNHPEQWNIFNQYLVEGVTAGRITVVGNSRYETDYYEYFTGQPALHISSLCEYIDRRASKYAPTQPHFLAFGEHAGCRTACANVPAVQFVRDFYGPSKGYNYPHSDIPQCRGIVWIPYNCSIMSFFEHYWLNVPLFVPTQRFLLELGDQTLALSQTTWHAPNVPSSHLPRSGTDMPDPNIRAGRAAWLPAYDFYNVEEFPHVSYFDSWPELKDLLANTDLQAVSAKMAQWNTVRKTLNQVKWTKVMDRVKK